MSARTPAHPPLPTPFPSATRRAADFLARADVLRTAGRLRQAAECYRQAIAYDGSRSAAHLGLGLALWEMGRRAEAIARLEEAVALDPRGHEPARALADAYAQCGHAGAAVKYYRQAEAADPSGGPVRTRAVRLPSVKRAVVW